MPISVNNGQTDITKAFRLGTKRKKCWFPISYWWIWFAINRSVRCINNLYCFNFYSFANDAHKIIITNRLRCRQTISIQFFEPNKRNEIEWNQKKREEKWISCTWWRDRQHRTFYESILNILMRQRLQILQFTFNNEKR